jgi:bacillithiol system protein YtxJ
MQPISTLQDWEKVLQRSEEGPVVVYKHSTTCGGCLRSLSEMNEGVAYKEIKEPIYMLTVQEARELSDRIAEDLMIEHESPQAIIVVNRRASYHTDHGDISIADISRMLHHIGAAYSELRS